jgi:hypothetical protein
VFGNFADTFQAIGTADGKALWSQHTATGKTYDQAFPSGADVIFRGPELRAHDQATGTAKWTLFGPEPLVSTGHCAVAGGLLAAAFGGYSGYAQGFFVARTDGRTLWTHWGQITGSEDWDVAVAGSSVFATDQQRLYCFRAGA